MATARAAIEDGTTATTHARVEAMLRAHHGTLLRIARRWSGSQDAAEDALQRAMEIYVRRLASLDPATEAAWLKVVVRHEAMAVQRAAAAAVPLEADDLAARLPAAEGAVEERIEREERTAHSIEALGRLKPDERTALLLKAKGLSYREIGERQGWTYTKVNRAITEGRRRFLDTVARIESGEECERYAPTLLALTQGRAEAADVVALRPHLRHCGACRGTVRELVDSRRRRLALHLPFVAGVAPLRWLGSDEPASWPTAAPASGRRCTARSRASPARMSRRACSSARAAAAAARRSRRCSASASAAGRGPTAWRRAGSPTPSSASCNHDRDRGKDKPKRRASSSRTEPSRSPTPTPTPIPAREITAPQQAAARDPEPSRPEATTKPKRQHRSAPEEEFGFEGATGTPGLSGGGGSTQPSASTASTSSPASAGGSSGGSTQSSSAVPTSGGEFLP